MRRLLSSFLLIYFAINLYATEENLYEKVRHSPEIKIYLEDIVNEADNPAVKTEIFRNVFNQTIGNRIGLRFLSVNDKKNADFVISARIKKYIFVEQAMPFVFSSAALVADSLSPKSSGKLVVDYEVRSAKDGKTLLHYKNFTTEERRPQETMKGEKGFVHSVSKSVNRFIYRAFHKPKAR